MSEDLQQISEALQRVRDHLRKLPADQMAVIENELDIVETGVADLATRSTPSKEPEQA